MKKRIVESNPSDGSPVRVTVLDMEDEEIMAKKKVVGSVLDKLEAIDTELYLDKRAGDSVIFCVIGFVCGMLTTLIAFSIKLGWYLQ